MHESPMPGDAPRRNAKALESSRYSIRRLPDQSVGVRRTSPFFAGLVVIAGEFHPIPFRTRPLKPPAPMVLRVNTRESRSPPGLQRTDHHKSRHHITTKKPRACARGFLLLP